MTPSSSVVAVEHVSLNGRGRDFIVGDIHGCFDQVLRAMDKMRFDQSVDRLFSVGDLIDRGPGSQRTARFLRHPWVNAVKGNHEAMLLELYADGEPHPAAVEFVASRNGFRWWLETPASVRADILTAIEPLPIAIEIQTPRGAVGLVHADVPKGVTWQEFTVALERGDAQTIQIALWGRDRILNNDDSGVEGIGRVFVGHTPVARLARLNNLYAIDTGAVYGVLDPERSVGAMTFIDICTQTNTLLTLGSMQRPADLVFAPSDAEQTARPFSAPGKSTERPRVDVL